MLSSALSSALGGLDVSALRLQASANNIANQESTLTQNADGTLKAQPYQPQQAVAQTIEPNGVKATLEQTAQEPVFRFDPSNPIANPEGLVAFPNIDIASETITRITAARQFEANVNVLKKVDETLGSLLDVKE
jgi:flagellar basal-body rod protein FlgC